MLQSIGQVFFGCSLSESKRELRNNGSLSHLNPPCSVELMYA
jgi:hypothetical protein